MKISKNSWHYRFIDWIDIVNIDSRKDLCSYMRGFFITTGIITFFLGAPLVLLYSYFAGLIGYVPEATIKSILIFFVMLWGFIGSAVDGLIVLVIVSHIMCEWFVNIFPERIESEKVKRPNIFIEYLKAKKKKICPLIEFED